MDHLPTIWFVLIAVLWLGYLFLEGFDLGVGMHLFGIARNEKERRLLLNTIGPVWDGNEVWLITAGGATFAAFPMWYASLFSALYIPLALVLLGLILRATSIEYRGKVNSDSWRKRWTIAMAGGSLVASFGIGAALALTTTGLPLNANGDREGGAFAWLTVWAVVGGLAAVGFCLVHAAAFLAIKTDGEVRERSRVFFGRTLPLLLLPMVVWVLGVQIRNDTLWTWLPIVGAVVAIVLAWMSMRQGAEMRAFLGTGLFLVLGVVAIFGAVYPTVLPSTIDRRWDLTIANASSSAYTLKIMSFVALFGVPLVLVYQAWSYYVFRKRLSTDDIPEPHDVPVAIGSGG